MERFFLGYEGVHKLNCGLLGVEVGVDGEIVEVAVGGLESEDAGEVGV